MPRITIHPRCISHNFTARNVQSSAAHMRHRPHRILTQDSAQTSLRSYTTTSTQARSAVKTASVALDEDDSKSKPVDNLVPCPYTPGNRLTLNFQVEDGSTNTMVEVVVIKAHSPFTLAQSMLVERTQPHPTLPSRFVLKAADPRFAEPDIFGLNRKPGWTALCEDAFKRGLSKVRSGEWADFWRCLGAASTTPSYRIDLKVDREHDDWMHEIERWDGLRDLLEVESEAYQALRPLQGSDIPRLYGSCTVLLHWTMPNLDPFVGNVPGLVLQYIEGTSLDRLTLGKDLSASDAERVSQGALAVLRKIRDALVIHGDFALRNIIVRPHDLDHPALIDFGSAETNVSGLYTKERWIEEIVAANEVHRARALFGDEGLHNPSPVPERYQSLASYDDRGGYVRMNSDVERLRPEWRDQNYEPLHDVPPDRRIPADDGSHYQWEYPRWRIKSGVNTANASADYAWGKKKPNVPHP